MIFVVGSGPAGVSASKALLRGGHPVTMLDAGLELEPERRRVVEEMRQQPRESWDAANLRMIREGMAPSSKGISRKFSFGSDFPFREADSFLNLAKQGFVETAASFALGGFSTIWGAAIMPFRSEDIPQWPITASDLAEHYREVLSFMRMSARDDNLAALFPLYANSFDAIGLSRQATAFLADLSKHSEALRSAGVHFGASRLAVDIRGSDGCPGCAYCGLCMYGCPYGLIYNSASTVRMLQEDARFSYVKNVVVQRLRENAKGVVIEATDRLTGGPLRFQGHRVCLACGPLATTRILLESLEAYERPITLLDSQHFLFPLLRYSSAGRASEEALHTLAQIFIEILDPKISARTLHLQVYTFNDLFLGAIKHTLGRLYPLLKIPVDAFIDRMLVAFGYLHSDCSPGITVTLGRPVDGDRGQLRLAANTTYPDGRAAVRHTMKKLWRCRNYLRAVPLRPLLVLAPAGRGFHSGGTFPMSATPSEFQSDTLGRPCGFTRVHAVDSTVFPSIPATTITLSIMANAHRIGAALSTC